MVSSSRATILLLFALCTLFQIARSDDIIWYQGTSDYWTSHEYAWQGTTDGKSAPELLIASVINQPWLVAISKTNNIIYWTDNKGVIGAWNITSRQPSIFYRFDIGNWNEKANGPALTGLDLDALNNHLYFTFNRSIYRLDLSQTNPSSSLIASYNNLVFNPRFSASQNLLFFCLKTDQDQGSLVRAHLSDPSRLTTLVSNASSGIAQQLFIDDKNHVLYYNSQDTRSIIGVSSKAPYNKLLSSPTFAVDPSFFDFNLKTNTFVFVDSQFGGAYTWTVGSDQTVTIYDSPSQHGQVTGVKFLNDETHVLLAYQDTYSPPHDGLLRQVNLNNPNETSVLLHNFGMGTSLIFDEKQCDFYYVANVLDKSGAFENQLILRKNINEDTVRVHRELQATVVDSISGIALDKAQRNLISSQSTAFMGVISYVPIDEPKANPVAIVDALGRSIVTYAVNEFTKDIFYTTQIECGIYRLDASDISKHWINNVGRRIVQQIACMHGVQMTVDSVNEKLYFTMSFRTTTIAQTNLDGSHMTSIHEFDDGSIVQSMKWDPSSSRLFLLTTDGEGWNVVSMEEDGTSIITTALNVTSDKDSFSQINPDPFSDWVYLNAEHYQPLRIKKDGSLVERLYSYVPFSRLGSIGVDEASGNAFYEDVQDTIKMIHVNDINKNDPAATNFEVAWQGDSNTFELHNFLLDPLTQMIWILQNNKSAPYNNHVLSATPVKVNGPTKQLFEFPEGVHYPWAINSRHGKLYAFSYSLSGEQDQTPALVMMDLNNGSNLVTLKRFTGPDYPRVVPTAVTVDPNTGLLYYALNSTQALAWTFIESFDPIRLTTKTLLKTGRTITDMKTNGTALFMATRSHNVMIYDFLSQYVLDLPAVASSLAVAPKTNQLYFTGGSESSDLGHGYIHSINFDGASPMTLLTSFEIKAITFDFANKSAYFSRNTDGHTPPYYYRSDLNGMNKNKIQMQDGLYIRKELTDLSFVGGKFYSSNVNDPRAQSLDTFDVDASGYTRIIQSTSVRGAIQYNDVFKRVYWMEDSQRLYSCAVYPNDGYTDCQGFLLFSEVANTSLYFTDFVVANTGVVYFSEQRGAVYSLNTVKGFELKLYVESDLLKGASSIVMGKQQSELLLLVGESQRNVMRVTLANGTISTVYQNVNNEATYLLATDTAQCK